MVSIPWQTRARNHIKMGDTLLQVLFSLTLLAAVPGLAGWESNGGDTRFDAENPWFLTSAEPIPYCLEVAPDYSLDSTVLKELTQRTMQKWAYFLTENGFYTALGGAGDTHAFPDQKPRGLSSRSRLGDDPAGHQRRAYREPRSAPGGRFGPPS